MARKEVIKKDYIIDTAFLLAKQEGFSNVTARKLAAKAGCSTQPIFRAYENMEDLWADVYNRAVEYYNFFYNNYPKKNLEPFVDLGMAYIGFAGEEPELFKLLFMGHKAEYTKTLYDILNGDGSFLANEFRKAKTYGIYDYQGLFTKIWIFINGIACMTITGDYDLNEEQTLKMLKETLRAFQ